MKKIVLVGTQGTGRTHVLKRFTKDFYILPEIMGPLAMEGINIDTTGNDETQYSLFRVCEKLLKKTGPYMTDKGLIEIMAWTRWLHQHNQVSKKCLSELEKKFKKFLQDNPDIGYAYFPYYPRTNKYTRKEDKLLRYEIDSLIQEILTENRDNIRYITIEGGYIARAAHQIRAGLIEQDTHKDSPSDGRGR